MALRNSTPLKLAPFTACDTLDSTDNPPGSMSALTNLIPDPSTKNLFQCRPAAIRLLAAADFAGAGFTNPGFISVAMIVGDQVYGMIACDKVPGHDSPFAYNLQTQAFVTVTGTQDATTLPVSPAATGAWVPPTMDLIGVKVTLTHPGFTGASSIYVAWIDVTDPAAPDYTAGDLTGMTTFTTPPSFVKNFNQRAYYLVNPPTGQPSAVFSDPLLPDTATNANQAFTFGDNVPLTALGALGVNTQLTGAVTQSLIVFKGVSGMFQITGDPTAGVGGTSTISINALSITTGTLAPLGICSTPKGLAFISPDGVRVISLDTTVSDPIGVAGQGVTIPFIYSVVPSRMVAACGGNVMRISTQNGAAIGSPQQEWWFDFARTIWTGPHTFASSLCLPYQNTFIKTPIGITAAFYQSDVVQNALSTFSENGQLLNWQAQFALFPDTDQMAQNAMVETTLYLALSASSGAVSCYAFDPDGTVLDTVQVSITGQVTLWGQFQWGQAVWLGASSALAPRQLPWTIPIVFQRLGLAATGSSAAGVKVGRLHLRYEKLGYLLPVVAA